MGLAAAVLWFAFAGRHDKEELVENTASSGVVNEPSPETPEVPAPPPREEPEPPAPPPVRTPVQTPPPAPPPEPAWVGRDGPPHRLAMAAAKLAALHAARDDNALRQRRLTLDAEARFQSLVEQLAVAHEPVQSNLFVVDVTQTEVTLLADASWGWPVGSSLRDAKSKPERDAPRYGLVWLRRDGANFRPKLTLAIGAEISAEVAKSLRWGQRLAVEFQPVRAESISASFVTGGGAAVDAGVERVALLDVADLRCRETEPRFPAAVVWPGWGTFPDAISRTAENPQRLFPFLRSTLVRGAAQLRVKRVTETQILLDEDVTPNSSRVPVYLYPRDAEGELAIPVRAVGVDAAAALEPGQTVLVGFTIVDAEPSWPFDEGSRKTGFGYTRSKFGVAVIVRNLEYRGRPLAGVVSDWMRGLR